MSRRALMMYFGIATCVVMSRPAAAEIHSGIGFLVNFDFSVGGFNLAGWDITEGGSPPIITIDASFPTAGVTLAAADVPFSDLLVAPTDPSLYSPSLQIVIPDFRTWVVRTREGHYAKFRFLDGFVLDARFEYVYQDDGTPSFMDPLPVEDATWGRIKAVWQ